MVFLRFANRVYNFPKTKIRELMDLKQRNKSFMNYSIIGSGNVCTALARLSSRKNIKVRIANSRGSKTLASLTTQSQRRSPIRSRRL